MIGGLVIGPPRPGRQEIEGDIYERCHPEEIREAVTQLSHHKKMWVLCTYSAAAIHYLVDGIWRKEHLVARVTLRSNALVDTKMKDWLKERGVDEAWLSHFALEDLYLHGEFDAALRKA